jgi:hypothetical protein
MMVDELGDLYYDSGDPRLGMFAVDTRGDVYNFYQDVGGERRVTPLGNVDRDLRKMKITEIAGQKLDRPVEVTAFADRNAGRVPLPPGSARVGPDGKVQGPDELLEGLDLPRDNPWERLMGRGFEGERRFLLDRYEVDLSDARPVRKQLWEQTLLEDPDIVMSMGGGKGGGAGGSMEALARKAGAAAARAGR